MILSFSWWHVSAFHFLVVEADRNLEKSLSWNAKYQNTKILVFISKYGKVQKIQGQNEKICKYIFCQWKQFDFALIFYISEEKRVIFFKLNIYSALWITCYSMTSYKNSLLKLIFHQKAM